VAGKGDGRFQLNGSRGLLVAELLAGAMRIGELKLVLGTVALTTAEPVE